MIISSFSVKGYKQYGKKFIESFLENWEDENLILYLEEPLSDDFGTRVEQRDLLKIDGIVPLFDRILASDPIYKGLRPGPDKKHYYDYRYDAYRFCRKVFAMCHYGLSDPKVTERFAWLDADTFVHSKVPDGFLKELIPDEVLVTYLGRPWTYSETGFIGFNPNHPVYDTFMSLFLNIYRTGAFRFLGEWHDCYAFDFVRTVLNVEGNNLSYGIEVGHPFISTILGKYMDHMKGPERKQAGRSPRSERLVIDDCEYWKKNADENKVKDKVKQALAG